VELLEEARNTFICVFNPARAPAHVATSAAAVAGSW
jgi:hypothetical protein